MDDRELKEWMSFHSKRLDKKYYSKGMSTLILHKRAMSTAFSVVENIRGIEYSDLALTAYFMIKDRQFDYLAKDYERILELAMADKDKFVGKIYEFYVKTGDKIRKNGLYKKFFELTSMFLNTDHSDMDEVTTYVYRAYTDNTLTGQFSSPFHMNVENKFHFGMSVERLFLWAYSAFSTDEMLPTTESYRKNLLDPYAEVSFTSIPGKLRVPTNCRHIRSIAGKEGYESTVKHINGYIRKLPDGQTASEKAVAIAESLCYSLAQDETYVCPFERTAWITRVK